MENKYILKINEENMEKILEKIYNISSLYPNIIVPYSDTEIIKLEKGVNDLCGEAYEIAKSKGWHDTQREIPELIALIHSEVSEALEADRKDDYDNFKEELADVCIRIFDLCGSMNIDLNEAIEKKMEINRKRPYKHGKRY